MGRLVLAIRVFFKTLFEASAAEAVAGLLGGPPKPAEAEAAAAPPAVPAPRQNAGVTVLAALQREARLVDFLKEPIDDYTDEQIGAAVRDIHRDAGQALERMFALRMLAEGEEGAAIDVPEGFDAGRYRLTGNVTGSPPFRGVLRHHGWQATRCDVPEYTGSTEASTVVAPAEVELT